jgi:SAM-dependent methyltransferase
MSGTRGPCPSRAKNCCAGSSMRHRSGDYDRNQRRTDKIDHDCPAMLAFRKREGRSSGKPRVIWGRSAGMHDLRGYDALDHQKLVNSHFGAVSSYWAEVYERNDDVFAAIYQERLKLVLDQVNGIALPRHRRVMEIGSGAGHATVALAGAGYRVDAIDAVQAMVDATRARAAEAGLASRVTSGLGDIHELGFPDETFGLVLAIGVLPWVASMERPIREICRVLEPGGYAIVSAINRWALLKLVEPFANPLLSPAKDLVKNVLRQFGWSKSPTLLRTTSMRECDALLRAAGLDKLAGVTLGFGRFTIFNHELLPPSMGMRVHRFLQGLADRRVPIIRSSGLEYVVLTRKRDKARSPPAKR